MSAASVELSLAIRVCRPARAYGTGAVRLHLGDEAIWVREAVGSLRDLGELAAGGAGEGSLVQFCVVKAASCVQDGADSVCLRRTM